MVNRDLRIVFMGTPDFAVPSLEILMEAGYPIVGVVTAPDKPGGRGLKEIMISPVKKFALTHGLQVLQPVNLKAKDFYEQLKNFKADLQVVVAFRMLPERIWSMPRLGTMNLHGSLLPAYRGAAPIQWAIINGEKITGLTTFFLQHQIDTGQIIRQREIPILATDNAGSLHDRMMQSGAGLVLGSVDLIATGDYHTAPQDDAKSSHAPKIHHQDGKIDWNENSEKILNLIRGMSPYPGAWTTIDGIETKVLKAEHFSDEQNKRPGMISIVDKKLIVQSSDGMIELKEIQMAGKRRMDSGEFLRGYRIKDWSTT